MAASLPNEASLETPQRCPQTEFSGVSEIRDGKAGVPLLLAGPIQPGQEAYFSEQIGPHLGGDQVRYLDEVGGAVKEELLANARSLLIPIT